MVKLEPSKANGLIKDSSADCFQVRSLSQERLIKKLGTIDTMALENIKEAIKKVFDI